MYRKSDGTIKLTKKLQTIQNEIDEIKHDKTGSVYVYIQKNEKGKYDKIKVRISYHAPKQIYGKLDKDVNRFVFIDILSEKEKQKAIDEKCCKLKEDGYDNEYIENEKRNNYKRMNEKQYHKDIVEKNEMIFDVVDGKEIKRSLKYLKNKRKEYVDCANDDFDTIIKCIKNVDKL